MSVSAKDAARENGASSSMEGLSNTEQASRGKINQITCSSRQVNTTDKIIDVNVGQQMPVEGQPSGDVSRRRRRGSDSYDQILSQRRLSEADSSGQAASPSNAGPSGLTTKANDGSEAGQGSQVSLSAA